ncbi:aspartic proteinase PCS1 [Mercurialis annua]|uniref:aspartic proteinase PCS1 n=1 Tax=Mercurialis annua TaxID=3986 RepID=UPI00215F009E|nr:aspartic proteinase PCS1 [Mercurialis annua]
MATLNFLALKTILFLIFLQSKHSYSSKQSSLIILPLKTQEHSHITSRKYLTTTTTAGTSSAAANKLFFHHNVSLTVTLTVGSPPQNITMVLDTGSELSWLHCKKTPLLNSVFNPFSSRTYSKVPCLSPTCRTRTRDFTTPVSCDSGKLCHVIVSYADATSVEGNLAFETFRIGSLTKPATLFGCMDSGFSSNSEEDGKTTGLMGMNRGSLSFVNQMGYPKFSYCISGLDSAGVLLLGDASLPWLKPLSYTPLIQISLPLPYFDRVAYTVQLEGIKVKNKILSLPKSVFVPDHTGAGQTMVDSGTQFTFLLGPVYTALKKEFLLQTRGIYRVLNDVNFVFQGAMDLCYLMDSPDPNLANLPVVSLMFQGAEMSVSGERLLYRVPGEMRGKDSVWCFTFGNSDLLGIEAFVIGHHHQQNVWMEYDLKNSRIGLADVRCDIASQKLGL